MPRALLPHARSLAVADSPLLPFLAPRIFAASPFRERDYARTPRHSQEEKEKNSKTRLKSNTYSEDRILESDTLVSKETCYPRTTTRNGRPVCSSLPSHPILSQLLLHKRVSCHRHANVFAIPRTQHASFTTTSRRQIRQRPERQGHRMPTSTLHFARTWERQGTSQKMYLIDVRRRRALRAVMKAYDAFLALHSDQSDEIRMRNGRYRSFLRRIYTLSRRTKSKMALDLESQRGKFDPIAQVRVFAALDQNVFHGLKRARYRMKIKHDPSTAQTASQLFRPEGLGEDVYMKWHKYSSEYRNSSWHLLLYYMLDKSPQNALHFTRVLAQEPIVATMKGDILADALEHIARFYLPSTGRATGRNPKPFVPNFAAVFLAHFTKDRAICSQDLLYNVARLAAPRQLRRVYDMFVEHKTFLGYETRLHYANKFGQEGDHEYALRCLHDVLGQSHRSNVEIVGPRRFSWTCALILRQSVRDGQNYHKTTDIVAEFLDMGLKLDLLLYNVIIHNAIEAGDYKTAFRVFNVLEDHHITPDKHTFSILLHGCTMLSEPTKFRDFALHCSEKAREMRDVPLATDYLYYCYVTQGKYDLQSTIACTRAYAEHFSLEPLLPFCPELKEYLMHQDRGNAQERPDVPKMEPPPMALYIMLQIEIRKAAVIGSRKVWELLFLFRRQALEGHHAGLTKLAENPLIWNAFLLSFCRKQQFADASQLMKHMTEGQLGFAQPNVYSWNIFMQSFWKSGQHKAAERIYEIMESRGVEPDQFTYSVLLRGYAKAQNAERVAQFLDLVNREEQLEPAVLHALTKMHDQKRLMMQLDKRKVARETEEREKEEERGEETWELPKFQSLLSSTRFAKLREPEEPLDGRSFSSVLSGPPLLSLVPPSASAPHANAESRVTSANTESADIPTPQMLPVRKVPMERPERTRQSGKVRNDFKLSRRTTVQRRTGRVKAIKDSVR
ncbi:hypothetical protein K491DRAFT_686817 [Lophiostoma macrostomum CBS 122681]|uniref:Pentacotripeptide-repeat region of PRORP domain-containing protein n=1 Tax=Lophiostoma macrostomum CBS 122681 TaxID=1314788 RepID=A0A6A6TSB5_9PLEO|nr:hypothetical protein K491DRAFT_686817 [Lophiostoma macrostomum CBS 122681]